VAFKAEGDKAPRRLLIGDKTATGGDLYAKLATPRASSSSAASSTPRSTARRSNLRDKSMLKFDRDKLDAVEVRSQKQTIRFAKADDAWRLLEPLAVRADYAPSRAHRPLSTGQMKSIAADEATDLGATASTSRPSP